LTGITTGFNYSTSTKRNLIHVMDREADITEVINACKKSNQFFVIRARHDRSTLNKKERYYEDDLESFRLFKLMRSLKPEKEIVRKLRTTKGKTYDGVCQLNFKAFTFRNIDYPITCVYIKEIQPPVGEDCAEWFLLTNMKVASDKDAEYIGEIYSKRWTIEDFHKCLLTQKRQFDSRKTLTTIIGLLAITAVALLRSRYLVKQNHDVPFTESIKDVREQKLAEKLAMEYLKPIDLTICSNGTMLWWVLLLGRLGGHQGYKQKDLPEWQTLW
jgi:hypothetical protein